MAMTHLIDDVCRALGVKVPDIDWFYCFYANRVRMDLGILPKSRTAYLYIRRYDERLTFIETQQSVRLESRGKILLRKKSVRELAQAYLDTPSPDERLPLFVAVATALAQDGRVRTLFPDVTSPHWT